MREFKFSTEKIEFLFSDEVYSINVTKAGNIMPKIGDLLYEASENSDVIEKNINEVLNLLDAILGEGSIERIFTGREIEICDVCDLVSFVSVLVNEYSENKKLEMEKAIANAKAKRFTAVK